jgi:hypothetical protein
MKKLFHIAAVVFLTAAFVSCTKSVNTNGKVSSERTAVSRDLNESEENWAKIYPSVEQPRPTPLGDISASSVFYTDDQAIFFVLLSDEVDNDTYTGSLSLIDGFGNVIQNYTMLPHFDPAAAFITVPADIANSGMPYMFAICDLDYRYTGQNVSMNAVIQLPSGQQSTATMTDAFTVQ